MYTYIGVCAYIYISIYIEREYHAAIYVYIDVPLHEHIYVCIYIYMYTHMYTYNNVWTCLHHSLHINIYTCLCMHISLYIDICRDAYLCLYRSISLSLSLCLYMFQSRGPAPPLGQAWRCQARWNPEVYLQRSLKTQKDLKDHIKEILNRCNETHMILMNSNIHHRAPHHKGPHHICLSILYISTSTYIYIYMCACIHYIYTCV